MRVLSIQSHVVSGYVGYDVDVVNTVQFSNHTGYGFTDGHKTTPEQLLAIFNGLSTNGLTSHSRILTGYIPGADALQIVAEYITKAKSDDPNIVYVLDPVMGDVGKGLYVSSDVVPIYKNMLRLATVITPNQFEAELLSGVTINSIPKLRQAMTILHTEHNLQHVVLSSIPLPAALVDSLNLPGPPSAYTRLLPKTSLPYYCQASATNKDDERLVCFASSFKQGHPDIWAFALPTVQGYFSGVGDLFSAMVLAHFTSTDKPLYYAVSRALMVVQQILLQTHIHSLRTTTTSSQTSDIPSDGELDSDMSEASPGPRRKARRMRLRELRIVPERHLLQETEGWAGNRIERD